MRTDASVGSRWRWRRVRGGAEVPEPLPGVLDLLQLTVFGAFQHLHPKGRRAHLAHIRRAHVVQTRREKTIRAAEIAAEAVERVGKLQRQLGLGARNP